MYTLTIRDYLKCAHSLKGEIFGPAQLLHVITYEVEVSFQTPKLTEHEIIVDFAGAQSALGMIIAELNFKNLDTVPALRGKNTTTEWLCRWIHEQVAERMRKVFQGQLIVCLRESPVAETRYEAAVSGHRGKKSSSRSKRA